MNTSLDLNRLIFDPAGADGYGGFDSNTIGSFVIDGYGNQITSTIVSGSNTSLDVFAALADGYGNKISSTSGALNVSLTGPNGIPYDTNYGVVDAYTLRTAAQIGNATGAADFNQGATTAQTLRVSANLSDGYGNPISSVDGALSVSLVNSLGMNLDTNYGTVTGTTLRTASQIGNATGAADFNRGATTAQTLRVTNNTSDGYGNAISSTAGALNVSLTGPNGIPYDTNYGVVDAYTLRTAAQIGNATGAADFNVGGPTAQTLRVVSDQADGYGNQITSNSLVGGTVQALDVKSFMSDGYGNLISSTAGAINVSLTGPNGSPYDTNYGVVGVDTLRTASQIGNATGAADFNRGATTAQTLRVTSNLSDGYGNQLNSTGGSLNVNVTNADPALYADNSMWVSGNLGREALAVRHDANTTIAAVDGSYAPLQLDAYGRLKVDAVLTVGPQAAEFLEESAHLFSDPLLHVGTVVKTDNSALPNSNNTYSSFFVDGYGQLKVVASFDPSLISNNELKVQLDTVPDNTPDAYNPIKIGSRSAPGPLTPLSAANDRADLISDLYRRIYINDSSNIGLKSTPFTVGTSESSLVAVGASLGGRRKMIVQNRSNKSIFVGATGVTVLTGLEIRGGQSMNLDIGPDVGLFAIAADAGHDIRVFELA